MKITLHTGMCSDKVCEGMRVPAVGCSELRLFILPIVTDLPIAPIVTDWRFFSEAASNGHSSLHCRIVQ